MATFRIPNQLGQIRQSNLNESQGEIIMSRNLDLITQPDKIKTTKKLVRKYSEANFSDDKPADIILWGGNYYLVTNGELFLKSDLTASGNWANANVSGDGFQLNSTICVFDGALRITDNTDIASWTGVQGSGFDADWWTNVVAGTSLTSGKPHVCAVVQSQKETFYVTDGNWVRYYEKDAGSTQNVELASNHTACCLAPALDGAMWVGTFSEDNGNAHVYSIYTNEDVGGNPVYRNALPIDGRAVLAIWVKDNTPFIVTEKGTIQQFNGAGFTTIAQFPFTFSNDYLSGVTSGSIQDSNRARPIHPRGVKLSRDVALIHINTANSDSSYPLNSKMPSGVWTFNHSTGQLSHFMSLCETTSDDGNYIQESSGALITLENEDGLLAVIAEQDGDTGLYTVSTSSNVGWFVTREITSDTVQEAYEDIYHKAKTLAEGEAIYTLYRTTKRDTIFTEVNWVETDVFTSTTDLSKLQVGELIVISETGKWTSVKSIEKSASTYRVTLNDALGTVGQTNKIISDNFKLIGLDSTTNTYNSRNTYNSEDGEYKQLGVNVTNGWIQFMVILDGNIEYRQFINKGNAKTMV